MKWTLIGILAGIMVGALLRYAIPPSLTRYTAVAIIGILDAIFGALRAEVVDKNYEFSIFFTGLLFNIILAVAITFLGDKMGLDLYLAASVVFTFRIFNNVGVTRRVLVEKWIVKKQK
jgi:small basic protein